MTCREEFKEELNHHVFFKSRTFSSICNSGDTFLTTMDGTGDIFDMEAFAIARVCKALGLPFAAVKYVTDIIGENSVKHWEEKLEEAQEGLQKYCDKYF